jgi:hypothetical protein
MLTYFFSWFMSVMLTYFPAIDTPRGLLVQFLSSACPEAI